MNYKKLLAYSVISVFFCTVGFGGGFLIGRNTKESIAKSNTVPQISLESYNYEPVLESENEENNAAQEKYLLKNENNTLTLYRISDEITSIIKSISINPSFLPADDRIKLEKGIYFDNIEEGFQLIEDFTS